MQATSCKLNAETAEKAALAETAKTTSFNTDKKFK